MNTKYVIGRLLWGIMAVNTLGCFTACEDDKYEPAETSEYIRFSPEVGGDVVTRSSVTKDARDTVIELQGGKNPLYLHVKYVDNKKNPFESEKVVTKGQPITAGNYSEDVGIYGFEYTGTWADTITPKFANIKASLGNDGYYNLSEPQYWPGKEYTMRFYGYAPYGYSKIDASGGTTKGSPALTVSVPQDALEQEDVIVATPEERAGNCKSDVHLNMHHIMCGVEITVDGSTFEESTLTKVELTGLKSEGIYRMQDSTWTETSGSQTCYLNTSYTIGENSAERNMGKDSTFMLMPQALGDSNAVVLTISNNGKENTLKKSVGGINLSAGKILKLYISKEEAVWDTTIVANAITKSVGSGEEEVKDWSVTCKRVKNNETEYLKCGVEYSVDGGGTWSSEAPYWVMGIPDSVTGGDRTNVSMKISQNVSGEYTGPMVARDIKGSEVAPWDLALDAVRGSENNKVGTTANCYVVNSAGYYCFPLVYGNAYENGNEIKERYSWGETNTANKLIGKLYSGKGEITNGLIQTDQNNAVDGVDLVWKSEKGLVDKVWIDSDLGGGIGGVVRFNVSRDNIKQGNVVLSAKVGSTVLWSWHIWICNRDLSNTVSIKGRENKEYTVMKEALGMVYKETITYDKRTCLIRFVKGNVKSGECELVQSAGTGSKYEIDESCTLFQAGRKDPFPGFNGSGTCKTIYSGVSGNEATVAASSTVCGNYAANSTGYLSMCKYPMKASSGTVPNMVDVWDRGNKVWGDSDSHWKESPCDGVEKTVYDPCPKGFHVGEMGVLEGLGKTFVEKKTSMTSNDGYVVNESRGYGVVGSPGGIKDGIYIICQGGVSCSGAKARTYTSGNYGRIVCCDWTVAGETPRVEVAMDGGEVEWAFGGTPPGCFLVLPVKD